MWARWRKSFLNMVGIDCYVFGYRKIKIPPDKLSEATSVLLRGSIPSRINSDGTFMIRERDFNKMSALFNGRIEFLHSKPLGLYGKFKLLKHKAIYISAIIFYHSLPTFAMVFVK